MGNHRLIVLIDIPVNVTLMENAAYFHKVESPVVELVLPEPNSTLSGTQPLTGRRSPLRPAVSPLIWTAMLLSEQGWGVIGIDNDMRATFLGSKASTRPVIEDLKQSLPDYRHHDLDLRDRQDIRDLLASTRPDFIVHAAGQPSHDKAAEIPYDDFDVNAAGTMDLLVATRDYCRDAPFCFVSSNKVYGDRPNQLPLQELATRYDFADGRDGIDENMPIDQCLHSVFGVSKAAADLMCQEFGRN